MQNSMCDMDTVMWNSQCWPFVILVWRIGPVHVWPNFHNAWGIGLKKMEPQHTHLQLQSTFIIKQNNYLWVCLACGCLLFYKATLLRSPPHPGSITEYATPCWLTDCQESLDVNASGWPGRKLVALTWNGTCVGNNQRIEGRVLRRLLADRLILRMPASG